MHTTSRAPRIALRMQSMRYWTSCRSVPGALDHAEIEKLFMSNPVWTAPCVNVSGQFFLPVPQLLFAYIHRIMNSLASDAGLEKKLQRRRAEYLETKVHETIGKILSGARLTSNATWSFEGKTFETDLIAQVDRTVLIIEAKVRRPHSAGTTGSSGEGRAACTRPCGQSRGPIREAGTDHLGLEGRRPILSRRHILVGPRCGGDRHCCQDVGNPGRLLDDC